MRILFITARPPWPGRRGDQARVAGLVEELASRHRIRIVSQCWPGFAPGVPPDPSVELTTVAVGWHHLASALVRRDRRPLQAALHRHGHFQRAVEGAVEDFRPDAAVVVLSRLGDVLESLGETPVVLDLIDALALNMAQRGHRQPFLRQFWLREARRISGWDRRLVRKVSLATVVSERDRRVVVGSEEALARRVRVLPFGLRISRRDPLAVGRRPVVALTGNLGYFPTVDGARWFAERVWPKIRRRRPDAEWWLAGSRPAASIRRLARAPGIRLIRRPDSLESVLHQASVAVAPLKAGSGTPIKILEAMAAGVPVVTTSAGRAGLDELALHAIRSADTSEAFARAVVDLLEDRQLGYRTASAAWKWLIQRHERRVVADVFEDLLEEVVARPMRVRTDETETIPQLASEPLGR